MLIVQMVRMATAAASTYVGAVGQLIVDLGTFAIRVQDGATPGGQPTLMANNNLSDLQSIAVARNSLGLGSAAQEPTSAFLFAGNNLSDLGSLPAAQANLGLGTAAFVATSTFDAAGSAATAQSNAEAFATSAANTAQTNAESYADTNKCAKANNLSDVASVPSARSNLGVPSTGGAGASGTWGISVSGNAATASSASVASTANAVNTGNNYQMSALGVGTAAAIGGGINAIGDIEAFYSDMRLKSVIGPVMNALAKLKTLDVFYYTPNERAQKLGYRKQRRIGISAQQLQAVAPEAVTKAPINGNLKRQLKKPYLTTKPEQIIPLLIAAIKEQQVEIEMLRKSIK